MKKLLIGVMISGISFLMITCKHEIPYTGSEVPTQVVNCSVDTVYFANEILPLIVSNCATSGCHDAASHKEGVVLTNYNNIRKYVTPYNPGKSELYEVITKTNGDRMPPAPMAPFTAEQKAKLAKWINQGAFNNECTGGCDSTLFTYSGAVAVTMNTYCKGCHNPASLGGGIDLSSYASVRTQALNGKLMGSITHTSGFLAMPQAGNKLSACQVGQVQKWIQSGTPNN